MEYFTIDNRKIIIDDSILSNYINSGEYGDIYRYNENQCIKIYKNKEFKVKYFLSTYLFNYLKEITEPECLKHILPDPPSTPRAQASKEERVEYMKRKAEAEKASNGYNIIYRFSSFADKLFSDSILIKLQGGLVICKRDKLRINKAQVSFENESGRKIQVLGVVSTVKEKTHPKPSPLDRPLLFRYMQNYDEKDESNEDKESDEDDS